MTEADRDRTKQLLNLGMIEPFEVKQEWQAGGPLPVAPKKMSDLVRERNEILGLIKGFLSERYPKSLVVAIDKENNDKKKTCLLEYFGSDRWEDVTNLKIEALRQGYARMTFEMDS